MTMQTHAWFAASAQDCLERLDTTPAGLSSAQATRRLAEQGPNSLPGPRTPTLFELFLSQFKSPLIYLLLAAAVVSLVMRDHTDAGFILVVLLVNAVIGTIQEDRAGASARALQKLTRQVARVERDGALVEIDAADLVPGDIVVLESGGGVPADLRLLSSIGLEIDESLLTGEALPVAKDADAVLSPDTVVGDRATMAHAGTMVLSGRARGLVVETGMHTQLGRIAQSLHETPPTQPPLMRYLARLSKQIAIVTVSVIFLLALAMAAGGTPLKEILLLSVALAVSAIPEGLPIAVTVALAAATQRMARRNVIVRALPAVEGLGACTVIATDKTGTLTQNRLSVEAVLLPDGRRVERERWGDTPDALAMLGVASAACNEASWPDGGEPVGDSVDIALLRFARATDAPAPGARTGLFPYEPANRFASVSVRHGTDQRLYAKGAVETIAAMCRDVDPALRTGAEALAADGYRVLALAGEDVPEGACPDLSSPRGLTMLGCVALLDPLRPETAKAVAACSSAGIEVRIVTGDHPATALTIARQLGLAVSPDQVLTGSALAALDGDAEAAGRAIAHARVFARTEPAQKLQIVQALHAQGHVVAVTGDGVNDAPALQAAAIGVAMGRGGTDVARGAADLVLTDDNFASIVAGVEEGRITFGILRKMAIFLLATGMAEIAMFLFAMLAGLPLPMTAVQVLWCNIVTEGAQTVTLAFGRGEGDELRRPPRGIHARLIDGPAVMLMILPALAMAGYSTFLLQSELARGVSVETAQSTVLLATVLFQNVFVLAMRGERVPIWRESLRSNPWLLLGVCVALALQCMAMSFPPLANVLGIGLPDRESLTLCLWGAAVTLVTVEATKFVLAHRRRHAARAVTE